MAYKYGLKSRTEIATVHNLLRRLFSNVLDRRDHSVLQGRRGRADQNLAFKNKRSKAKWGMSAHNCMLPDGREDPDGISMAIDAAPYPIDWGLTGTAAKRRKAIARFYEFHGYGVDRETERIDMDEVAAKAREIRPRVLLVGASAYSRTIDFAPFAEIAREVDAHLMVDMAHIAGLVAAGVPDFLVQHAITIEEQCAPYHGASSVGRA